MLSVFMFIGLRFACNQRTIVRRLKVSTPHSRCSQAFDSLRLSPTCCSGMYNYSILLCGYSSAICYIYIYIGHVVSCEPVILLVDKISKRHTSPRRYAQLCTNHTSHTGLKDLGPCPCPSPKTPFVCAVRLHFSPFVVVRLLPPRHTFLCRRPMETVETKAEQKMIKRRLYHPRGFQLQRILFTQDT